MKTYQYWVEFTGPVEIRGVPNQIIKCYVGSNYSPEDAAAKGPEKLRRLEAKINGRAQAKDYEIEIREEVFHTIDPLNVLTRNRYGALVLNTQSLTILDIDTFKLSLWDRVGFTNKGKKPGILQRLQDH